MVLLLDPAECFRDSPRFRADVTLVEQSLDRFSETMKKIVALGKKVVEAERAAIEANKQFAEEIANVVNVDGNVVYENEGPIVSSFSWISQSLKQIQAQRELQVAALESSILVPVQNFVNGDIAEIKKQRAKVDTDVAEFEAEQLKYCSLSRRKELKGPSEEAQSLANSLRTLKKAAHSSLLAYCGLLNEMTLTKKLYFLEGLVSYMYNVTSSDAKVHKILEEAGLKLKDLNISIQETRGTQLADKKNDELRIKQILEDGAQLFFRSLLSTPQTNLHRENSTGSHVSVSSTSTATSTLSKNPRDDVSEGDAPKLPLVKMEGFLMKKSSGARKQWSRRYFILNLQECRLDYVSSKDTDSQTVAAYLTEAKITDSDHDDRRFVLHISTPSVSYHLQAETEGDYNDWKNALLAANQHGPLHNTPGDLSLSKLRYSVSISSSTTSLSGISFRSPSKSFFDSDELGNNGDSSTLKSGELYFKKGAKKASSKSTLIKMSSQLESPSTGSASEWKRVYCTLSKDARLVIFDFDKDMTKGSVSKKQLLVTKVAASIDLASLEDHAVQEAHESVTGRRCSFAIATKERTFYLSANTGFDKDEWVLLINKLTIEKQREAQQQLRTTVSVSVEVAEARGLSSGDSFCEVRIDETLVAVTSVKSKTSSPYWAEEFAFDDLRDLDVGVILTLKSPGSRYQKDSVIGHVFIPSDTLVMENQVEGWFPIAKGAFSGKPEKGGDKSPEKGSSSEKAELKVTVRYQTSEVMPLESYESLAELVASMDADSMFEIAKVSSHLEGTARNILRLFLGRGTPVPWLKKVVGNEILQTDNVNVMFRANSLATKALDQYMKVIGMEYLERTLGETVRAICEYKGSCEVDPTRLDKDEDVSKNWTRLIAFVKQVWHQISKSANDIPKELRSIFHHIQKTANDKFGGDDTRGSVRYTTVSGFLFLRFFCPAVLTPKLFGLLNEHPDERTRRTLTLITKTLQSLANLGNFSVKEAFMQPMNEFLMDHTSSMMDFIDEVSSYSQPVEQVVYPVDLEREYAQFQSLIVANKKALEKSKSPQIRNLLTIVDKLEVKLDSMSRVSLGAFLKMEQK